MSGLRAGAASKSELYGRAQALELPGRSAMTKRELVAALQQQGGGSSG